MSAMPRPDGRAKKIAYKIMGVPSNMLFRPSAKQKKIEQALTFEETRRAR